jgi:hypothetical protein
MATCARCQTTIADSSAVNAATHLAAALDALGIRADTPVPGPYVTATLVVLIDDQPYILTITPAT